MSAFRETLSRLRNSVYKIRHRDGHPDIQIDGMGKPWRVNCFAMGASQTFDIVKYVLTSGVNCIARSMTILELFLKIKMSGFYPQNMAKSEKKYSRKLLKLRLSKVSLHKCWYHRHWKVISSKMSRNSGKPLDSSTFILCPSIVTSLVDDHVGVAL